MYQISHFVERKLPLPLINRCARYSFFVVVTLGMGMQASATPGDLDPTFGNGGRVTLRDLDVGSPHYSMIQQSDGKLVITGGTYVGNFVRQFLFRLESDGLPDAGFGTDGAIISAVTNFEGASVIQQTDGKLVIGGTGGLHGDDAVLWRLQADGTNDSDFGVDGIASLDLGDGETVSGVVEQAGGQLIVAGTVVPPGRNTSSVFFARMNGSGDLDPTFGSGGTLIVELPTGSTGAMALLQQTDEGLIWAGHLEEGLALVAITAGGVLRSSFGREGVFQISAAEIDARHDHTAFGSAALQADGRIIVVGSARHVVGFDPWGFPILSRNSFAIRLTPDGALDSTFASDGIINFNDHPHLASVEFENDGKILIAFDRIQETGLMRFNADGSIDQDYGVAGTVVADFRSSDEELIYIANDLIRQADGKFVIITGAAVVSGPSWFPAIARFQSGSEGFPGQIGLDRSQRRAREGDSSVVVFVRRTGGSEGAVSASFATVNDSATQGADYVARSGRLHWDDGDISERAIRIDLIDDVNQEPVEQFTLELSAATGGASLTANVITILIDDDDVATPPLDGGGGAAALELLLLLAMLTAQALCRQDKSNHQDWVKETPRRFRRGVRF